MGAWNKVAKRQSLTALLLDLREELHGQQRVSAQLKKVFVDADFLYVQQVGPDAR